MNITWLGQSGYILDHKGDRVIVDPYLSDIVYVKQNIRRLVPPPVTVDKLAPNYILISHDHLDHFDPETSMLIHERYPDCRFVGPASVVAHARKLGIREFALINLSAGERFQTSRFEIQATPAYHSDPFAVGFLISGAGIQIYMTGDTLFDEALAGKIKELAGRPIDFLFIVINGRLGNMNVEEAVEVARRLQPGLAIPMHYGMFAENTEDPKKFIELCRMKQIHARELNLGRKTTL